MGISQDNTCKKKKKDVSIIDNNSKPHNNFMNKNSSQTNASLSLHSKPNKTENQLNKVFRKCVYDHHRAIFKKNQVFHVIFIIASNLNSFCLSHEQILV